MPIGVGKYQYLAENVMQDTNAATTLVIVLRGTGGSGAALAQEAGDPAESAKQTREVVKILRDVADSLERDALAIALSHPRGHN